MEVTRRIWELAQKIVRLLVRVSEIRLVQLERSPLLLGLLLYGLVVEPGHGGLILEALPADIEHGEEADERDTEAYPLARAAPVFGAADDKGEHAAVGEPG